MLNHTPAASGLVWITTIIAKRLAMHYLDGYNRVDSV